MGIVNDAPTAFWVAVLALIGWRVYLRVARMFRRQQLSLQRAWIVVILFSTLLTIVLVSSLSRPAQAVAALAGVAGGAALGRLGLRLTRFENTPLGLFYTPNAHLGVALSLLFLGRLTYRAIQLSPSFTTPAWSPDLARNPLTLLLFATLAGYYVSYSIGLLQWRDRSTQRTTTTPRL